ncbi:MAG TPA: hypothetical protein VFO73_13080 [Candidatus Limnocylindrales bacterium]|jgi:hypothetical protein|nr:hypothetical protein [Candidatus Limnocylindrales bacterium]
MIAAVYLLVSLAAVVAVAADIARTADVLAPLIGAAIVAAAAAGLSLVRLRTLTAAMGRLRDASPVLVTGLAAAPPGVDRILGELRGLGLDLIGATDTTIAGQAPIRTWVVAGEPWTTWAEVGAAGDGMAVFLSQGATGRFLETTSRGGEQIDRPTLLARTIDAGPAEVLATHRATLEEWTRASGPPRTVGTMADYEDAEAEQRRTTAGMRIAAHIERVVTPGIRAWTAAAILAGGAAVVVVALPAIRG